MRLICYLLFAALVPALLLSQEAETAAPASEERNDSVSPPPMKLPPVPAPPAVTKPRPLVKATPMQQVVGFYATVNGGYGAEGLRELLATNPVIQPADTERVANAFAGLMAKMGRYIDFEILEESEISSRVRIMKTVANFETQPFVNEFTFYDPGDGHWRLVHLRYDPNVATMFSEKKR